MFGKIELENFTACELNQEAASAWSAVEELCGAGYVPLLYLGKQVAKGTDYFFIAQQTLVTNPPVRRVVSFCVNLFEGKYSLVNESFEVIL